MLEKGGRQGGKPCKTDGLAVVLGMVVVLRFEADKGGMGRSVRSSSCYGRGEAVEQNSIVLLLDLIEVRFDKQLGWTVVAHRRVGQL